MVAPVRLIGSARESSESTDSGQPDGGAPQRLPLHRRPAITAALVATIMFVALAVRVAEVQRTSYRPIGDATSYLQLGSQITDGGDYSRRDRGAGGTKGPTAYFAPGFPYLIALVDEIDGHHSAGGATVKTQRIAQVVIGTLIVGMIGLIALECFGAATGLVALAIAAVYPVLIELSAVLVAENLMTLFELAAVWCALRAVSDSGRVRWAVATGVMVGLAALTHTNGILLAVPLGVALVNIPGVGGHARRVAGPSAMVAAMLVTLTPWLLRDETVMHHFVPISDEAGITLIGTYNHFSAVAHPPYKWRYYANIPSERRLVLRAHRLTEPQLSSKLVSETLAYIGKHPSAPLDAAVHNTLRLLELEGSFAWRASAASIGLSGGTAKIGVISFWLLLLLAVAGAFTRLARRAPWWLWSVPVLIWLSVVLVNAETPRFREPIDPFLILLAACALTTGASAIAGATRRATAPPHYDVTSRIVGPSAGEV